MAVSEDAATPAIQNLVNASGGVATSNTFTPPSGTYVVVVVSWLFTNNASATLSCKDSLGNTYTSLAQKQDGVSATINALFGFYYTNSPGSITVKLTCTNTGSAGVLLAPRVLDGAASNQSGAGVLATSGSGTTWTGSLTTTQTGSLVYVTAGATSTETLSATGGNTTLMATASSGTFGDSGAVGRGSSTTGTPGPTTFGFSSSASEGWGLAAIEILPAAAAAAAGATDRDAAVPGPAWGNYFGVLSHTSKQSVDFDYRPQIADRYITAGDLAFGANTLGRQFLFIADPVSILPSPAWANQFQPYLGQKQSVLFDVSPPRFIANYLTAGDIAFGANSSGFSYQAFSDRAYSIAGPPFRNQFQQSSLTKEAVFYDFRPQFAGNSTANLAFGANSLGTAVIPGLVPAPPATPGPALQNLIPFFAGYRKAAVLHSQPYAATPFGPFCFGGSESDVNLFGGSQIDTNLYGGSQTDTNLYGGVAANGCPPQNIPIVLGEFNDEVLNLTILNNGVAFNYTGFTLLAYFKTAAGVLDTDPSTLVLPVTQTNPVLGLATLTIPRADLQNTNFGFWRVDLTFPPNSQATAIFGSVSIRSL